MSSQLIKPIIGFAGMSHLGLVSATAVAEKGFSVISYDPSQVLIATLNSGQMPIEEPQLNTLLSKNRNRLSFTHQIVDLNACDIIYIALDVPTNSANVSDIASIELLFEKVISVLSDEVILVLLSQVPPGFTRRLSVQAKQLYYQVETLIFGQAVHRALYPERFIVGCADPKRPLPWVYETLLKAFDCPVLPMRYESAELAKLSINLFLVSSVTTTNILAEMSTAVGADWDEIVPTLQLDKRIGPHAYLKPGLGIAGGNLERDLETLIQLGDGFNVDVQVVRAWCDHSRYQKDWAYRCLQQQVFCHCADPSIAVLGLAYKANTHSTKNSAALTLLEKLVGSKVKAHDPVVRAGIAPFVEVNVDIEQVVNGADVLIAMTPWPEYADIDPAWLKEKMRGNWIVDPFQIFDHVAMTAAGFRIFTLGKTLHFKEHQYV